jgi:hypothetical protein
VLTTHNYYFAVYAALLQLKNQYGFEAFIDTTERDLIAKTFLPEIVQLPVLSETFCNFDRIPFWHYNGRLEHLITDETFRTGHLILFYPMITTSGVKGGFT